jgi:hypothetical protein
VIRPFYNTDQAQQRKPKGTTKAIPKAALDAVAETLNENGASTGGTTYMQARTALKPLIAPALHGSREFRMSYTSYYQSLKYYFLLCWQIQSINGNQYFSNLYTLNLAAVI